MRISRLSSIKLMVLLASLFIGNGCRVILPRHSNSLDIDGEKIAVRFLSAQDFNKDSALKSDYRSVFEVDPGDDPSKAAGAAALAPLLTPVIEFAVGQAIEFGKRQMKIEAGKYEAQYIGRAVANSFYGRENIRYFGFEIVRTSDSKPSAADPSARIVFGMALDADKQKLLIAPLRVQVQRAKAKILGNRLWIWVPPFLFWRIFLDTGSVVALKCDLDVDYSWRDEDGKMQRHHEARDIPLPQFDISDDKNTKPLGPTALAVTAVELSAPPRPTINFPNTAPTATTPTAGLGAGTFAIKLTITESDPSNARDLLKLASEELEKERQPSIDLIVNMLPGAKKEEKGSSGEKK